MLKNALAVLLAAVSFAVAGNPARSASEPLVHNLRTFITEVSGPRIGLELGNRYPGLKGLSSVRPDDPQHQRTVGLLIPHLSQGLYSFSEDLRQAIVVPQNPNELKLVATQLEEAYLKAAPEAARDAEASAGRIAADFAAGRLTPEELQKKVDALSERRLDIFGEVAASPVQQARDMARKARAESTFADARRLAEELMQGLPKDDQVPGDKRHEK